MNDETPLWKGDDGLARILKTARAESPPPGFHARLLQSAMPSATLTLGKLALVVGGISLFGAGVSVGVWANQRPPDGVTTMPAGTVNPATIVGLSEAGRPLVSGAPPVAAPPSSLPTSDGVPARPPTVVASKAALPDERVDAASSTFAAEAALLREAKTALLAHDLPRARSAVERHAHLFPAGALARERQVLALEIRSQSGDAHAAGAAQKLLNDPAFVAYQGRLRALAGR